MKGGDPLGPLTPCHSSTKVTPGGGNEGEGRSGPDGGKEPSLCLPHHPPCSLLFFSIILPCLTSTRRPCLTSGSLCRCPPLYSLFTYFCLAGIYSENDGSTFPPSTEQLLPCPPSTFSPPAHFSAALPLSTRSIFPYFVPSLSKWLLWTSAPALCLSI